MSELAVESLGPKPDPVEEACDAATQPSTDVYTNPRESSSRMGLEARAYAYRTGASIAFGMGNMASPAVPSPHKTLYLPSTLSKKYSGKDKIRTYVWFPDRPGMGSRKNSKESIKSLKREEKAAIKEEKKRKKREKKERRERKKHTISEHPEIVLEPTISRTTTASTVADDDADDTDTTSLKSKPSVLSRASSRLSIKSSKSSKLLRTKSSSSLLTFTPSVPASASASASNVEINPMDKIPNLLTPQADPRSRRPAIINFHGGGFVLGQGTDDGRWVMAVMQALGAVVFSVEYRLAPSYPFPTPVEDCADAILQIWRRADEFWIDRDKIVVSGFSAGGTLALASWVLLADYKKWGYDIKAEEYLAQQAAQASSSSSSSGLDTGADSSLSDDIKNKNGANDDDKIQQEKPKDPNVPHPAGLMLFYPLLDWTQSRPTKRLTCCRPDLTLGRTLTDLFDASYLYPYDEVKAQLTNPLLSPGLMPDDLIDRLPPVQLCLCEYDMLLAEGRRFHERLVKRGKKVGVREVKGARHAWDKPNGLLYNPPESMGVEYAEAVRVLAEWIGKEEGNGSAESSSDQL